MLTDQRFGNHPATTDRSKPIRRVLVDGESLNLQHPPASSLRSSAVPLEGRTELKKDTRSGALLLRGEGGI